MPIALGLGESFWTMRLSFSPESTQAPSSRSDLAAFSQALASAFLRSAGPCRRPFHHELDEGVAGARGRGRTQHLDLVVRKRRVDVLPGLVGVGDQLAACVRQFLGEGPEDALGRQCELGGFLRVGDHDAVETNLDLDDFLHAVLLAGLVFTLLDRARGIGDVRIGRADAGAEQLEPAARAGRFHDRGLELADLAELLGNRGGEGINGG